MSVVCAVYLWGECGICVGIVSVDYMLVIVQCMLTACVVYIWSICGVSVICAS